MISFNCLKASAAPQNRLVIFLNTPGGSAEIVEKLVKIIRSLSQARLLPKDC